MPDSQEVWADARGGPGAPSLIVEFVEPHGAPSAGPDAAFYWADAARLSGCAAGGGGPGGVVAAALAPGSLAPALAAACAGPGSVAEGLLVPVDQLVGGGGGGGRGGAGGGAGGGCVGAPSPAPDHPPAVFLLAALRLPPPAEADLLVSAHAPLAGPGPGPGAAARDAGAVAAARASAAAVLAELLRSLAVTDWGLFPAAAAAAAAG